MFITATHHILAADGIVLGVGRTGEDALADALRCFGIVTFNELTALPTTAELAATDQACRIPQWTVVDGIACTRREAPPPELLPPGILRAAGRAAADTGRTQAVGYEAFLEEWVHLDADNEARLARVGHVQLVAVPRPH